MSFTDFVVRLLCHGFLALRKSIELFVCSLSITSIDLGASLSCPYTSGGGSFLLPAIVMMLRTIIGVTIFGQVLQLDGAIISGRSICSNPWQEVVEDEVVATEFPHVVHFSHDHKPIFAMPATRKLTAIQKINTNLLRGEGKVVAERLVGLRSVVLYQVQVLQVVPSGCIQSCCQLHCWRRYREWSMIS